MMVCLLQLYRGSGYQIRRCKALLSMSHSVRDTVSVYRRSAGRLMFCEFERTLIVYALESVTKRECEREIQSEREMFLLVRFRIYA